MAGTRTKRPRRAARSRRPSRPALGNDPFERGAAPRAPTARPPAPPGPAARLDRLEATVEAALSDAEERLERVLGRGAGRYQAELKEALARLGPALQERLRQLASLAAALAGSGPLDPWGMDPRLAERAAPLLDFLYRSWWRVEARGLERLPPGAALVAANCGGALPWDALVLRLAVQRSAGRELRPLLDEAALALPAFGAAARRLGAVQATPEAAGRLLAAGALVGVFPEGARGRDKPWSERYRLQRFGRGGFAKVALRAGVLIVPCAIVGAEEATPPAARPGWLGEFLGLPFLSMAPALPLGPLKLLPLPSRWSVRCGDPVETRSLGAAAADDPAAVAALTESVRGAVQRMLDADVAARTSVFL